MSCWEFPDETLQVADVLARRHSDFILQSNGPHMARNCLDGEPLVRQLSGVKQPRVP